VTELARELEEAGGIDAPPSLSARLRRLLLEELERGSRELPQTRTGYGAPICVAIAPGERQLLALAPAPAELRADPGAVVERTGVVVAAALEALVEAADPGPPARAGELQLRCGAFEGFLALAYPVLEPGPAADFAALALTERLAGVDRLRCVGLALPAHVAEAASDWRDPIGPTHPLRVAEALARLGGSSLDEQSLEAHGEALATLLEPANGGAVRAHDDPDPVRRMARRILQRLDGMGKWGGYHTEFVHLAQGFGKGNERALALEVGEALVAAGLLGQKTSVGQRHVFLNPRRSGEIRALIDRGQLPPALSLPRG
jgi:hypothetical protein